MYGLTDGNHEKYALRIAVAWDEIRYLDLPNAKQDRQQLHHKFWIATEMEKKYCSLF
jgi:hypothetical protein